MRVQHTYVLCQRQIQNGLGGNSGTIEQFKVSVTSMSWHQLNYVKGLQLVKF